MGLSSTNYSALEGDKVTVSLELTGIARREVTVLIETQNGNGTGSQRGWLDMV